MEITTPHLILGEPQVAGPLAVFPVFGPEPRLGYRAFAQASELGAFVKELDEAASVGELVVRNPTDLPLLVYDGEEVLGAQQDRTFDASVLVDARSQVRLNVSCVEQGRWDSSRHGEHFRPSPQAADPSLRRLKRRTANAGAASGGPPRAHQAEVWREVDSRLADHAVSSPSAAMSDLYDGRRDELAGLARAVSHVDSQVGALAEIAGAPVALDLVSRPSVFAALLSRLAQGYALDALGRPSADPDPEAAERFVSLALASRRAAQSTPGVGRAFGIEAAAVVGSGLEADGELVQLCAFPDSANRGGPAPAVGASRIARPSLRRRRIG
jgi:hypothetical protein